MLGPNLNRLHVIPMISFPLMQQQLVDPCENEPHQEISSRNSPNSHFAMELKYRARRDVGRQRGGGGGGDGVGEQEKEARSLEEEAVAARRTA